jgi:lipopolysaccharide export system permease protein
MIKVSILQRYIIKQVLKYLLVIFAVSCLVFLAYSSIHFLEDAASGELPANTLFPLISLKVLIACEVLFPLSFFLAGIQVFSRMHSDREIVAMQASGIGLLHLYVPLILLAVFFSIITACLSIFVRPAAYEARSHIQSEAKDRYWFQSLAPGKFYQLDESGSVFFVMAKNDSEIGEGVFLQNQLDDSAQVIFAKSIKHNEVEQATDFEFSIFNGCTIMISGDQDQLNAEFKKMNLNLHSNNKKDKIKFKIKSEGMQGLLKSKTPEKLAELQWRFSNPVVTFLLGIFCLPLSILGSWGIRSRTGVGLLIYATYYVLQSITRTWVEQSAIPVIPGSFYPTLLLALLLIILLVKQNNYLAKT